MVVGPYDNRLKRSRCLNCIARHTKASRICLHNKSRCKSDHRPVFGKDTMLVLSKNFPRLSIYDYSQPDHPTRQQTLSLPLYKHTLKNSSHRSTKHILPALLPQFSASQQLLRRSQQMDDICYVAAITVSRASFCTLKLRSPSLTCSRSRNSSRRVCTCNGHPVVSRECEMSPTLDRPREG
jgi:hypothetical protein